MFFLKYMMGEKTVLSIGSDTHWNSGGYSVESQWVTSTNEKSYRYLSSIT